MKEYNIVVLGACRSGKTQLITRYTQHTFTEIYDATIEDLYTKETCVDGSFNLLKILDTQGIEQFKAMRDIYIKNAEGFILVYDTTNPESLSELDSLAHKIKTTKSSHTPLVVAGTKADKNPESSDAIRIGAKLAASLGSPHVLTSARQSHQVDTVFEAVIRQKLKQQPYRNHIIGPSSASSSASIEGWIYTPSERGISKHPPTLKSSMIKLKRSMSKLRGSKSMRSIRKAISTASFVRSHASSSGRQSSHQVTGTTSALRFAQPATETAALRQDASAGTEPFATLRETDGGEYGLDESGFHTVTQSNLAERPQIIDVTDHPSHSRNAGTCSIM